MSRQIVEGAEDVKQALRELPDKLRRRALRNALAAAGRLVKADARQNVPILKRPHDTPTRTVGLLRDSIAVRTSKRDKREGNVGVFVNIKPAKGMRAKNGVVTQQSQRGARSKLDPYYWQWIEFGRAAGVTKRRSAAHKPGSSLRFGKPKRVNTGAIPAFHFLRDASMLLPTAGLRAVERQLRKEVSKFNGRRPD